MFATVLKQLTDRDEVWDVESYAMIGPKIQIKELTLYRALDDDRIPYYLVIADDEGIEKFFEWAMADVGVTIIQKIAWDKTANNVVWADTLS